MQRRAFLAAVIALIPAAALASGSGEKEGKDKPSGDTYLPIPALNTSVSNPYGGRTVLTIGLGLDAPDPDLRVKASLLIPRLRAAYLEAVQAYGAGLPPGAAPNADLLAQKLQQVTDRILGKAGARVLFASMVVN